MMQAEEVARKERIALEAQRKLSQSRLPARMEPVHKLSNVMLLQLSVGTDDTSFYSNQSKPSFDFRCLVVYGIASFHEF